VNGKRAAGKRSPLEVVKMKQVDPIRRNELRKFIAMLSVLMLLCGTDDLLFYGLCEAA
jgi:hypothetical protein